jgi:Protein kinase domain/Bacterial PH domain
VSSRALRRQLFEGEDVILITRLHVRRLWPTLFMVALVLGAVIVILRQGGWTGSTEAPLGAGAALLGLTLGWRVLQWRARRFVVTTHRLIHLSGVLTARISSAPLVNVADLGYRRSLLGRLLGYGYVVVVASDWRQRIGPLAGPQRIVEAVAAACSWSSPGAAPPTASDTWVGHEGSSASQDLSFPELDGPSSLHLARAVTRGRPREGSLIDARYLLEHKLASGGMGTVFQGLDERLGRPVAIKVLKEELAEDARFVERFRREARAAAALSHPNITAIFDYGQDDGLPYIVMELVRGRDLG